MLNVSNLVEDINALEINIAGDVLIDNASRADLQEKLGNLKDCLNHYISDEIEVEDFEQALDKCNVLNLNDILNDYDYDVVCSELYKI